ncbi:MAG: hypothetical protein GY822_09440 [Deltaproteobacteria bacterium]|nr:hypothetical protein [Deltaproteobacteria bacterium]
MSAVFAGPVSAADGVHIAVLPFEGEGSGGFSLAEAVEFEMEVLDDVVVESSRSPSRAWFKAKKKRKKKSLRNKDRKKVLAKFSLDALLVGESGIDEDGDPALHVIGYGADGKARFYEVFPLPEDIDQAAAGIVRSMSSVMNNWANLPSLKVRIPKPKKLSSDPDDDDILVGDRGRERPKKKKKKKKKRKRKKKGKRKKKRDDGDDINNLFVDDDEPEQKRRKRKKRRSRKVRNDDEDEERRSISGRSGRRAIKRKKKKGFKEGFFSVLDGKDDLLSFAAASGVHQGSTWRYFFDAVDPGQSLTGENHRTSFVTPYPSGFAQAEIWPVEWVGVAVDGSVSYLPFKIDDGAGRLEKPEFSLLHFGAGAMIRARYVHRLSLGKKVGTLGVGGGFRMGYRYWGSTSEPQRLEGTTVTVTVIPGFNSHALVLGPEVFFPFRVFSLPGEIQATVEVNPSLSFYEELPDAPGQQVQAFGWYAKLAGRIGLPMGAFVEANVLSNGVIAIYDGTGQRRRAVIDANTGEFEKITGGQVVNFNIQAGLGLGFAF